MNRILRLIVLGLAAVGGKTVYNSYQEKKTLDAIDEKLTKLNEMQTDRETSKN